jgi:hypothetical protein
MIKVFIFNAHSLFSYFLFPPNLKTKKKMRNTQDIHLLYVIKVGNITIYLFIKYLLGFI